MATLDDILGNNNSSDNAPSAEKGTQQWSEENSGDNAPSVSQATPPVPAPESDSQPKPAQNQDPGAWVKWFIENNPYEKPKTPEEIEKEKKKHKRAQIFAAISDGISAISNLYFATQYAPNMFDGKNTLTGANQVRYDKLVKDRKENDTAYFNGMMRAMQADERKAEADRSWKRTLDLDKKNYERYEESIRHRNERERLADERYDNEQEYKRGRDAAADQKWQQQFDEGKRRANQSHNLAVQQQRDNKELRQQQIAATGARAVRGKQLGFADGDGNQVSIYENVWKGSMQQVYDVLAEDMRAAYEADKQNNPRVPRHKTASEKEDFVKQNWHKSPRASSIMLSLSKLDPATMTSTVNDDGVEDYTPSGGDDEVIDYVPGNNK